MPRKRKSLSLSPQRKTSNASIPVTLSSSATLPLPPTMSGNKKEMLSSMCEMFPNLEPSLVEMVLSEYSEVEIVMDYLLELSTVAKGEAQLESTGFEKIAAYLDGFQKNSQSSENVESDNGQEYFDDSCIDESAGHDLDMLLDEALDRYGLSNPEDIYSTEQPESSLLEAAASGGLSQQDLSTSPRNTSFHSEYMMNAAQPHMGQANAGEWDLDGSGHEPTAANISTIPSFEMENTEAHCNPLPAASDIFIQNDNLGTSNSQGQILSSKMSAIQILRQERKQPVLTEQSNVHSVSPKSQIKWNPLASSFFPTSNQQGSFITPIIANPVQWSYAACAGQPSGVTFNAQIPSAYVWNPFPQTHWTSESVKPMSVLKPKQQSSPISKKGTRFVGKVMILMRGAPGSGKSTLARMFLEENPTGVILSSDEYFCQNGQYKFDINVLSEAHDWNQKRAKDAFEKTISPIIIDNTNLQGWEMKPYVSMAMKYKYKVTFREPDTWWRYKPKELERRNIHGVKKEKIVKMLENFERVTVNSILNLSCRKEPESSDAGHIKTEEKNGANNNVVKEANISKGLKNKSKNTSEMDGEPVNKSLHEAKNGPKPPQNTTLSTKQNIQNTDGETEDSSDVGQCIENISNENQPQSIENTSSEICLPEEIREKEDDSDIGCSTLQLDERQEPPSFVGDWPIEQTLRQRAPRNRKKTKSNCKSVPHSADEKKTVDPNLEQMVINSEPDSKKKVDTVENILKTEPPIGSHCDKTDLQEIENKLYIHDEDKILAEEKAGGSGDMSFDNTLEDPQFTVNDVTTDILSIASEMEKVTKPGKRSCRKCKLALTFSNSCPSSLTTDGTLPPCELKEEVDQSSGGTSTCTQTEPHEFAVAWRVEKKNLDVFESLKILTGKVDRFKSKSLETNEHSQADIPYRMMHHKSTFVEEDEIPSIQNEDSLQILCKLFRSLSFDVLKDLYERCNKDLEWATNLLLDSGEKMYKDEQDQEDWFNPREERCAHLKDDYDLEKDSTDPDISLPTDNNSELTKEQSAGLKIDNHADDSTDLSSENCTLGNTVSLVVAEELKNGNVLSSAEVNEITNHSVIIESVQSDQATVPDTIEAHMMWSSRLEGRQFNSQDPTLNIDIETNNLINEKPIQEDITPNFESPNDGSLWETDIQGDMATDDGFKVQEMTEVQPVVAADKLQNNSSSRRKDSLKFDYLELSLPPELAFQLTELFGPVGIDPGSLTIEDCLVPIDLKLAEAIHKKWKQSIMERHNQEALSYQLLLEDFSTNDHINLDKLLQEQESRLAKHNVVSQGETDLFPFMDQWNTRTKKVSLREIMSEEMALQARQDMKKPLPSTNCAVKMKEKQLLELFPNMEQNLLLDIFKENNYSLEKTEEFISSALEADPVLNVVAPGFKQEVSLSTYDRSKEKRAKADKEDLGERYFQDLESPEYDDFRAEAILYHKKQQESYRKAAEAHNRGMKQVAAFYAQQGYLYGQKMKEENHRAAVQIFERANEYLLPENILDLHGLHVDEAMKHFRRVLQEKSEDLRQNGGSPHLLVITGRGNRSQGGVPRIKPAVIDYLTNHDYRFQEKTQGAIRITLK